MFGIYVDRSTRRNSLITSWVVLGVGIGAPAVWLLSVWIREVPSKIADFHPAKFVARAACPFFYSIGDDLKYSEEIDPHAPTLLKGQVTNYLVSPDRQWIAAVTNGSLMLVHRTGTPVRTVVPVDSIYRGLLDHKPKPMGKQFFRDQEFQWSRDSGSLYLIRDQFYDSQGSQLFSKYGELWKYDLRTGTLSLVLKPFPASDYFFGLAGIYFSVPTPQGDLKLEYFDGKNVSDRNAADTASIDSHEQGRLVPESTFYSFFPFEAQPKTLFPASKEPKAQAEILQIRNGGHIVVTRGLGLKGAYYCIDPPTGIALPGGRYVVLDAAYCGNYNGQLLIDSATGSYEALPPDTRIYQTINTNDDPNFSITAGGITP